MTYLNQRLGKINRMGSSRYCTSENDIAPRCLIRTHCKTNYMFNSEGLSNLKINPYYLSLVIILLIRDEGANSDSAYTIIQIHFQLESRQVRFYEIFLNQESSCRRIKVGKLQRFDWLFYPQGGEFFISKTKNLFKKLITTDSKKISESKI